MKRGCRWRSLIHGSRSLCNRATRDELELDRRIEIFRGYHEGLARNPVRNSILPLQRCTKSFLGRFRHRKLALSFFFFFFPFFPTIHESPRSVCCALEMGSFLCYCITTMRGIHETKPSKIPRSYFVALFKPNSVSRLFSRLWING